MLTESQIERYSRHIILKEVGGKGQQKLFDGRVLIIGAGGLGAPIALYLAAAGVGTIGIADAEHVVVIGGVGAGVPSATSMRAKARLSTCTMSPRLAS